MKTAYLDTSSYTHVYIDDGDVKSTCCCFVHGQSRILEKNTICKSLAFNP